MRVILVKHGDQVDDIEWRAPNLPLAGDRVRHGTITYDVSFVTYPTDDRPIQIHVS